MGGEGGRGGEREKAWSIVQDGVLMVKPEANDNLRLDR